MYFLWGYSTRTNENNIKTKTTRSTMRTKDNWWRESFISLCCRCLSMWLWQGHKGTGRGGWWKGLIQLLVHIPCKSCEIKCISCIVHIYVYFISFISAHLSSIIFLLSFSIFLALCLSLTHPIKLVCLCYAVV